MGSKLSPLLFCASFAACGFLTPEDLKERGVRDSVTGFVDGPGIEVCFDGRRVVSPSKAKDGPLSLCLAQNVEPVSCLEDGACGRGERCICGRCMTRACRNSTDCESGELCQANRCTSSCGNERPCAIGEVCSSGGCARPCTRVDDCAFGESCSAFDGTCVVKLCSKTVSCSGEETCASQQHVADLRQPHLLSMSEGVIAYFEMRSESSPQQCAIHRARVPAPRRWVVDPITPVLAPSHGDDNCLGAPSVLVTGNKLALYAARGNGSAILRAHSDDGVTFIREPQPVLTPSMPWEDGWVGAPAVAHFSGGDVLAYEGGRGRGIGFAWIGAVGADRVSDAPWLTPASLEDPVLWRHIERVGSPFLVVRDAALLVYLTVRGVEGSDATLAVGGAYPADVNDSIGLVSTRDLVGAERFPGGPLFSRRTNLRAYLGESEPAVLFHPSGSWLVYAAGDASGQQRTGFGLADTMP